jgi:hypothetical protein
MTLCAQTVRQDARLRELDVHLDGRAAVGEFVEVTAAVLPDDGRALRVSAEIGRAHV